MYYPIAIQYSAGKPHVLEFIWILLGTYPPKQCCKMASKLPDPNLNSLLFATLFVFKFILDNGNSSLTKQSQLKVHLLTVLFKEVKLAQLS